MKGFQYRGRVGAPTYKSVILEHVFGDTLRYFEVIWPILGPFWGHVGEFWDWSIFGYTSRWGPRGGPPNTPQYPPPIPEAIPTCTKLNDMHPAVEFNEKVNLSVVGEDAMAVEDSRLRMAFTNDKLRACLLLAYDLTPASRDDTMMLACIQSAFGAEDDTGECEQRGPGTTTRNAVGMRNTNLPRVEGTANRCGVRGRHGTDFLRDTQKLKETTRMDELHLSSPTFFHLSRGSRFGSHSTRSDAITFATPKRATFKIFPEIEQPRNCGFLSQLLVSIYVAKV